MPSRNPLGPSDPDASPINALPAVVVLLALPIVAVELILAAAGEGFLGGAAGVGWRLTALQDYAFFGTVLDAMIEVNRWPPEHLIRFVSYPFVHAGFTQMIFVLVFLLALGKMVGEIFAAWAVLAIFFGSAIAGALAFTFLTNDPGPLVGGYPAVYGLIGAYTFLLWVRMAGSGLQQARAFSLIGVLLAIQLLFGLLFGGGQDWIADLAGFVAGFGLSFLVSPGGFSRALARMRRD